MTNNLVVEQCSAPEEVKRNWYRPAGIYNRKWFLVGIVAVPLFLLVVVTPVAVTKRKKRASSQSSDLIKASAEPSLSPSTLRMTTSPTVTSSRGPSMRPTPIPTSASPTQQPTSQPTGMPLSVPTQPPTFSPTSSSPTQQPTSQPTGMPLSVPTQPPTFSPSLKPTAFDPTRFPQVAVSRLRLDLFKKYIETLSSFGDRVQGSGSYNTAENWVQQQLVSFGFQVEHHFYEYRGQLRKNTYVTKVGRTRPQEMYIVSAHLDGRGGGGAANDDGSGCALILEVARVLGSPDVQVDTSIRMIFWNNEETGLNGARAYVNDRRSLQGVENPAGQYSEPRWLGVVTHDQILFDHGLPVQAEQSPNADADIEYQTSSAFAAQSRALAQSLQTGNTQYAKDYPAEVSGDMCCTDSVPFQDVAPAVSIRENRRRAEIGQGSQPNWHQPTDVYATYSELDFLFGFNIVQTTLGTIGQLVSLRIATTT